MNSFVQFSESYFGRTALVVGMNVNWYSHYVEQYAGSLKS